MADIADDDKGRPPFVGGQALDVFLGLSPGTSHGLVPLGGTAFDGAGKGQARALKLSGGLVLSLLGFKNKTAFAVEVDALQFLGPVVARNGQLALETIGIFFIDRGGGFGPGQVEGIAQLGEKNLRIRLLGAARFFPAGDEFVDGHGVPAAG